MLGSKLSRLASLFALALGIATVMGEACSFAQPVDVLPQLDPEVVKTAIDKGVAYLRKSQNPGGSWGPGSGAGAGGGWAVGYTCLAGITLIECGVPATAPELKKAATVVRSYYSQLDSTYEVALGILFLDRMKDKQDKKAIEFLAARLIAAQTSTGGWGYRTPRTGAPEAEQMLVTLRKLNPPPPPTVASPWERPNRVGLCIKMNEEVRTKLVIEPPKLDEEKKKAQLSSLVPTNLRRYPVFVTDDILALPMPTDKGSDPDGASTDNSNVHFAILGLWAARRSQVPVERSFNLLTKRFQQSQASDGSWAYRFYKGGVNGQGRGAMTGVALLGLAIGHALGLDRDPNDPGGKLQTERLVDGFVFLSSKVGNAVGNLENRPTPKDVGGLYFLWAMERVAVLYDLPSLGNKDWYRWGAEILLAHQEADGQWENGGFHGDHPVISTSMALMFLKRANLTNDLSKRALIDRDQLTKKVEDKLPTSKPVAPPPQTASEEVVVEAPPPDVKPTPKIEAPKVAAVKTEAPAPAPPPKENSGGGWIYLLLGLLAVGGLVGFLVYRKFQNGHDDDEDRPRKKRKKESKLKAKMKD